jgi:hypothetical protein
LKSLGGILLTRASLRDSNSHLSFSISFGVTSDVMFI